MKLFFIFVFLIKSMIFYLIYLLNLFFQIIVRKFDFAFVLKCLGLFEFSFGWLIITINSNLIIMIDCLIHNLSPFITLNPLIIIIFLIDLHNFQSQFILNFNFNLPINFIITLNRYYLFFLLYFYLDIFDFLKNKDFFVF
jgi:hypothetical protein